MWLFWILVLHVQVDFRLRVKQSSGQRVYRLFIHFFQVLIKRCKRDLVGRIDHPDVRYHRHFPSVLHNLRKVFLNVIFQPGLIAILDLPGFGHELREQGRVLPSEIAFGHLAHVLLPDLLLRQRLVDEGRRLLRLPGELIVLPLYFPINLGVVFDLVSCVFVHDLLFILQSVDVALLVDDVIAVLELLTPMDGRVEFFIHRFVIVVLVHRVQSVLHVLPQGLIDHRVGREGLPSLDQHFSRGSVAF
mmetsp:Transcript_9028/g.10199  ORF Transcript_9028/g.10199 Transcript_9028/m.10199 type:complete len:246 (-) Transcript_9028:381-1118(-)